MADNKVMREFKEHPLLTLAFTIIATAVSVFATTTFATMSYVDKEVDKVKSYVDDKHVDIKDEIGTIRESVQTTEGRVYEIWKVIRRKDK